MSENRLTEALRSCRPNIAVSCIQRLSDKKLRKIAKVCDVFELRADHFDTTNPEKIRHEIRRFGAFPTLLTVRWNKEDGKFNGNEQERFSLIQALLPDCDGIDIEINAPIAQDVVDLAHTHSIPVIGSYHNFTKTPDTSKLYKQLERSVELGTDYTKLALMLKTKRDYKDIRDFTKQNASSNIITVGMGEQFGSISRIELPFVGSKLTYASADKYPVASGQLDYKETRKRLNAYQELV